MKRLNPNTQKPFVCGDVREDGYLFLRYESQIKKNGFFRESWLRPEKFKMTKIKDSHRFKKKYPYKGTRLLWGWKEDIGNNPVHLQNCRELWHRIVTRGMQKWQIRQLAATDVIAEILIPYASDYGV